MEDPCEGCLIQPICEKMCEKVTEYYKARIRIRSKDEVQMATGYYWEDDYVDNNGVTHMGHTQGKITPENYNSVEKKNTIIDKIVNLFKKGLC